MAARNTGMVPQSRPPSAAMPFRSNSIGTTARSWAIKTPTTMRPVSLRSSPISSSIFMATAVLDRLTTKPSSRASSSGQPKSRESARVITVAMAICIAAAIRATFQIVRKARNDSFMAMTNSSSNTPSSASIAIQSRFSTNPRALGPRMTPAKM